MRRFYTGIVKHRKLVVVVFVVLAVLCAIAKNQVDVNYDMHDYLPEDSHSTVSLDVMEDEFEGGIPNARVMIYDVSIPEALAMKEELKQIDGVTEVTWLDDVVDVTIPVETLETDTVETYYKDNAALYTVTISDDKRVEAVTEIRELIGEENAVTGSAVSTATATTSTVTEIAKIAICGVALVFVLLLVTTASWFEPVIILAGLGVAILINAGTNLIFGEISFVTNAAGSILQLAVSLDYSVFLIHRFAECRREQENLEIAMVDALCKSTSSILSSGLTTVIGFLALILMRFGLGPDLGLALAKGVALSLITVFIFMPALILMVHKILDRLEHRPFIPDFHRFGRLVRKIMLPMVIVFAVVLVPVYLASNSNSFYYGSGHMFNEKTELGQDIAAINEVFGESDTYVLLIPKGDFVTETKLSERLQELPQITSIISYVDLVGAEIPVEYLDEDTLRLLQSEHYDRMVLNIDADYEGEETFELVKEIRNIANGYYPGSYYLAGEGVSTYDLMKTVTADMVKVNLVAIAAVFLVLLWLQRDVVLPILLVLCIETAIWINLSVPYFRGQTVFYIAYLIISSVQLGATVDYAILFSDRYREFRQKMDKKKAIVETVSTVTISILITGITLLVVGFGLGIVSSNGLLSQLGYFLGVGAICSLAMVLFVLPGLLYLFDRLFVRDKKKKTLLKKDLKEDEIACI